MPDKLRILVTPLDWGLGHATRSVPVIRELLRQGAYPLIGTSGQAKAYLQSEFPGLRFITFPSYDIRYPSRHMFWNIGIQGRKLAMAVWREHRQVQRLIKEHRIRAIISDNRFGCFSRQIPSVFITHQTHILIPGRSLRWMVNRLNRFFIQKYNECWIPDLTGANSLSGELSTPFSGMDFRRLGILSRFSFQESPIEYDILVLLSGPEPQRSYLEQELILQLRELPYRALLVQGKPEKLHHFQPAPNVEGVSFLTSKALQWALSSSRLVICRSGYSSLMDLAAMGKKALLIPTPGQTEQEYLAERMQFKGFCPFQEQKKIQLEEGIELVKSFKGMPKLEIQREELETAIHHLIEGASYLAKVK